MCSLGISIVFRGHRRCVPWASALCSVGIAIIFHGCCLSIPWTSALCSLGIGIVFHGHSRSMDIGVVFCGHQRCIPWASPLCSMDVAVVFCGQGQKGTCYLADSVMTVCLAAIPFPLKISWFICGCLVLKRLKECFVLISSIPAPEFIT